MKYHQDSILYLLLILNTFATPLNVPLPISLSQNLTIGLNPLTGNTPSRPTGGFTGQSWLEAITQGLQLVHAVAPEAKISIIYSKPNAETTDPSDLTRFEIECFDSQKTLGSQYLIIEGSIMTDKDRKRGRISWQQPRRQRIPTHPGGRLTWPPAHDIFEAATAASDLGHPSFDLVWCLNWGGSFTYNFRSNGGQDLMAIDDQTLREVEY